MLQKSGLQAMWFFHYRCPNKESVGNRSITLLACVPNTWCTNKRAILFMQCSKGIVAVVP